MKHDFNIQFFTSNLLAKPKLTIKEKLLMWSYRLMVHMPLIGISLEKNFALAEKILAFFTRIKKINLAFDIAIKLLTKGLTNKKAADQANWWRYMRLVISVLQDQQISYMMVNPNIENQLLNLSFAYKDESFVAHDKAFCLIAFSLWVFERGKINIAIVLATDAAKADPNWGYSDFMIGWYNLFVGGHNSVQHFNIAVSKDWNFLHRINKDKICLKFPSILKAVNRNLLVVRNRLG